MSEPHGVAPLTTLREQIADATLLVGALVGAIPLVIVLMTNFSSGWGAYDIGLIVLYFGWLGTALFRNRVPYLVKSTTIIVTLYGIAVINLLAWGLIGASGLFFVALMMVTMLLHNFRTGLISYGVVVFTVAITTLLVTIDVLTFDVDFQTYAMSNESWFTRLAILTLVCALIVVAVGRVIEILREQLDQSLQRTDELAGRTLELTAEMQKRETAEKSLAQIIDQMKDLDQLKDEFLDSVSHELRTPIANIRLYHQLIAMRPEKQSDYMDVLKQETDRLHHIVEQMIHASSDEYDMQLTTMEEIDLNEMVRRLFMDRQDRLQARHITLKLPDTREAYCIFVSPEHVERVMQNLVDNAVKYATVDGEITVEMLRNLDAPVPQVGITITNTAECPPPDEQSKLFDRFTRGTNALNQGVPGAGLGLSIVRQIADKYRGSVTFNCQVDRATVTLWLPSSDAPVLLADALPTGTPGR